MSNMHCNFQHIVLLTNAEVASLGVDANSALTTALSRLSVSKVGSLEEPLTPHRNFIVAKHKLR